MADLLDALTRQERFIAIVEGMIEMTASGATQTVSILICTYSRAELLRKTLLSLAEVNEIEQAEVIVVDNNSKDHTKQVVADCIEQLRHKVKIVYIFEEKQGLSVARNTGMDHARAPIVAFLDDDAVPVREWLQVMRQAFQEHPEAGAVGGIIHPDFEGPRPDWLIQGLEFPYAIVNLGENVHDYPRKQYPFGANMAVRRGAIGSLQFPENLGRKGNSLLSGEETYFFARLRKQGWTLLYYPAMAVAHHIASERLNKEWIRKRYYYQGVSMAMEGTNAPSRIRIVSVALLRGGYAATQFLLARSAGNRLLAQCRLDSVRGTFATLYRKHLDPSYE
jgi:glucosyl-dolichyl phosphate glucuronosyltransferase